jgi:hypothetical protein
MVFVFLWIIGASQFKNLRKSVRQVSCRHTKKNLQRAVEIYLDYAGSALPPVYKALDIQVLIKENTLKTIPVCGEGGIYRINDNGMIYCSFHDREVEE